MLVFQFLVLVLSFWKAGVGMRERLDEVADIIIETLCSAKETINIAGEDYPARLVKGKHKAPPKFVIFFKGKDADAITNAFKEYTADMVKKAARPSVLAEIRKLAQLAIYLRSKNAKKYRKGVEYGSA